MSFEAIKSVVGVLVFGLLAALSLTVSFNQETRR